MDFAHLPNMRGMAMGVRWQRAPAFGMAIELTHGLHELPVELRPSTTTLSLRQLKTL